MQKYPSGTIYRRHFPDTLRICRSLPYGTPKAETAYNIDGIQGLAKEILRQSGSSSIRNDVTLPHCSSWHWK
jgi:hypothetical protein